MTSSTDQSRFFAQFNLGWELENALHKMGYISPTAIQSLAIPPAVEGRDIIGQARTGTGKTAAFAIPAINSIDGSKLGYPRALVLAPTRELATQIKEEARRLGLYKKIRVVDVVGGRSIERQVRQLRKGAHIVVGTPGRIMDMSNRGHLNLDFVEVAVLDEADEMLNMGFLEDVEEILRRLPEQRQTFLFSATMEERVMQIAFNHMSNPKIVRVKEDIANFNSIEEIFHLVHPAERFNALLDALDREMQGQSLIFCRTKREVDAIADRLAENDYSVEAIHGDFSQSRRDRVMKRFKEGKVNILVATDVAARGIHVDDITTVVNYRLPEDPTTYVHRIGRTGRIGKKGLAITLYTIDQKYMLSDFKNRTKTAAAESYS
jgi:ATP-dependent RNA helicase DeaD